MGPNPSLLLLGPMGRGCPPPMWKASRSLDFGKWQVSGGAKSGSQTQMIEIEDGGDLIGWSRSGAVKWGNSKPISGPSGRQFAGCHLWVFLVYDLWQLKKIDRSSEPNNWRTRWKGIIFREYPIDPKKEWLGENSPNMDQPLRIGFRKSILNPGRKISKFSI